MKGVFFSPHSCSQQQQLLLLPSLPLPSGKTACRMWRLGTACVTSGLMFGTATHKKSRAPFFVNHNPSLPPPSRPPVPCQCPLLSCPCHVICLLCHPVFFCLECSRRTCAGLFAVLTPVGQNWRFFLVSIVVSSQEPHLLEKFEDDFYDEKLHVLLCGFIRNELNFNSLGENPAPSVFTPFRASWLVALVKDTYSFCSRFVRRGSTNILFRFFLTPTAPPYTTNTHKLGGRIHCAQRVARGLVSAQHAKTKLLFIVCTQDFVPVCPAPWSARWPVRCLGPLVRPTVLPRRFRSVRRPVQSVPVPLWPACSCLRRGGRSIGLLLLLSFRRRADRGDRRRYQLRQG